MAECLLADHRAMTGIRARCRMRSTPNANAWGVVPPEDPETTESMYDPMALNFNPCSTLPFDDGSCQYLLEFRVDATQWGTVPGSVGLAWLDGPPLTFEAGGFGTWTGSLVVGNGIWTYGFKADGQPDGVQRTLDLTSPVDWDGEVIRTCLGQAEAFCSGCTDPDDPGFSPFAGDDTFCGLGNGVGCTLAGADNFDPTPSSTMGAAPSVRPKTASPTSMTMA